MFFANPTKYPRIVGRPINGRSLDGNNTVQIAYDFDITPYIHKTLSFQEKVRLQQYGYVITGEGGAFRLVSLGPDLIAQTGFPLGSISKLRKQSNQGVGGAQVQTGPRRASFTFDGVNFALREDGGYLQGGGTVFRVPVTGSVDAASLKKGFNSMRNRIEKKTVTATTEETGHSMIECPVSDTKDISEQVISEPLISFQIGHQPYIEEALSYAVQFDRACRVATQFMRLMPQYCQSDLSLQSTWRYDGCRVVEETGQGFSQHLAEVNPPYVFKSHGNNILSKLPSGDTLIAIVVLVLIDKGFPFVFSWSRNLVSFGFNRFVFALTKTKDTIDFFIESPCDHLEDISSGHTENIAVKQGNTYQIGRCRDTKTPVVWKPESPETKKHLFFSKEVHPMVQGNLGDIYVALKDIPSLLIKRGQLGRMVEKKSDGEVTIKFNILDHKYNRSNWPSGCWFTWRRVPTTHKDWNIVNSFLTVDIVNKGGRL